MTCFFGAIADDFTGATDLAGLLARSGVQVSLRIGIPEGRPTAVAPMEIIALKCRTAPVDVAVAEARDALTWLKQAGAQRFFWKYCSTFDSTPQGNIGPVAEALMADLETEQTIYCPAFPENGRSIFMGNLFVGEQPLAESPMKDHPLTPMRDSNLMRLLAPQLKGRVGLANRHVVASGEAPLGERLAQLLQEGVAHVIIDAVANADLQVIAQACKDMTLLTGGSAIAMPLPNIWMKQGHLSKRPDTHRIHAAQGPAIILSGSCSAMTNRQVATYLGAGKPSFKLDPDALAAHGPQTAIDWLESVAVDEAPLIYATATPEEVRAMQEKHGVERASSLIEKALADCALKARDLGFRRFIVAGGETSGAVTKALGIARLDIGAEIAPGVPWCFAETAGQAVAVALKSGNFGKEDFFNLALKVLEP